MAAPKAPPKAAPVAEAPPPPGRQNERVTGTRQLPRWVPVGMAAAIGWIVLATGAAFYFWQQWQGAEEDLQLALAQNQQIAQQYEAVTGRRLDRPLLLVRLWCLTQERQVVRLTDPEVGDRQRERCRYMVREPLPARTKPNVVTR